MHVAHAVGRQHAANGALDQTFGVFLAHFLRGLGLQAAGITAVGIINFLRPLVAAEFHFVGVEDDHMVAIVDVRGPGRLVLAGKSTGNAHRERAQALPGRINDIPIVLGIRSFHLKGTHNWQNSKNRSPTWWTATAVLYRRIKPAVKGAVRTFPADKDRAMTLSVAIAALILAALVAVIAVANTLRLRRMDGFYRRKLDELLADAKVGRPADFREAAALLGEANAQSLNDFVALVGVSTQRANDLLALGSAADGVVERQERLGTQLALHTEAIAETKDAARRANGGINSLNASAEALANSVADSSAAIEETFASIKIVSDNMGGLSDTVNNVSAAIGELAASITHVAGNAQEANQLSLTADEKARDGGKAVERLVESTRAIATDINSVVAKMEELGNASVQIGNIVEVIDTIADQTNLLALNAAIEAARAGEHGRGFAVVADEVRKLAENSASSTKEIGSLVKSIQSKTGEVVRSTTESGNKATTGLQMADLAGRAISDILQAVAEASRLIEQISNAAREQATGSAAIVRSVEQMNDLMREAARSLEEQHTSNAAMTMTVTQMQQLTDQVTAAIEQQRSASNAIETAAAKLERATQTSVETSNDMQSAAKSMREQLSKLSATNASPAMGAVPPAFAQLAGASRN